MTRLEDIKKGSVVKGIIPNRLVTIRDVNLHPGDVLEVTYEDNTGQLGNELLYRDSEPLLELVSSAATWTFGGDGELFRLVSEAYRIHLAYLFDPMLAVHTSMIDPLPHQITAVYDAMLSRQPLRFLLADDPGAGKTIMAGLLIKELLMRGDLQRCMIIAPGNLVEQWQDELWEKFQLHFEIMTNDKLETARSGNWLAENDMVICRLDKLSRDENLHPKIQQTHWDLVVCDEAHKMSATVFGKKIKRTKRHQLGQMMAELTRHFLLMTATPHNGKEEDFQLFMSLLDPDRFSGSFRAGAHSTDVSDIMRRMVKEELVKFDGRPLFPERRAYTVPYELSEPERFLYEEVTSYVREQFNLAEQLQGGRRGTIGFALTVLQRRLASSPEAIYQSLKRRRERLEARMEEEIRAGMQTDPQRTIELGFREYSEEDILDMDDAPAEELEAVEEEIVDSATTARTIEELRKEIGELKRLEKLSEGLLRSGSDRKWEELSKILQQEELLKMPNGTLRKLVIFTEHKDTLTYLHRKIQSLIGRPEAIVTIHGGVKREERKLAESAFKQQQEVRILLATDAAGEGINLQRAHLMINYDLPWNPNRLEQRFGRIHRIGQREVCHLWNLVAMDTREGVVWLRLLDKISNERGALDGKVFDVLGDIEYDGKTLKELLIEAIRYGDDPKVKARLDEVLDHGFDKDQLEQLIREKALYSVALSQADIQEIKGEMERAEVRKLQPHFIGQFFIDAFQYLGGRISTREEGRYMVRWAPSKLRQVVLPNRKRVLENYERITFKKELVKPEGKAEADFVCPGHPLLDATIRVLLDRHSGLLKQGAILVDENEPFSQPRLLFYLEHTVQDAQLDAKGQRRPVSKEVHFLEIDEAGKIYEAGPARHLDYRPLKEEEKAEASEFAQQSWLQNGAEAKIRSYAIAELAKQHLNRIQVQRQYFVEKTRKAVQERLTKEINYWDKRARQFKEQANAGRPNAAVNASKARETADRLQARLEKRLEELDQELKLSPKPPVIIGGALILPAALLKSEENQKGRPAPTSPEGRAAIERAAMQAVMEAERKLGFIPSDVSKHNLGYDIESVHPTELSAPTRFIEVKGRVVDGQTITITKNELLASKNLEENYFLAIVKVGGNQTETWYVDGRHLEDSSAGFAAINVSFQLDLLLEKALRMV